LKLAKNIVILCLVGLAAFLIWHYFFPAPEKVIRRELTELAQAVSARPEGNFAKVANVNHIVSFFHPEVSINVEQFGLEVESVHGIAELRGMAFAARQNAGKLKVNFENLKIELNPAKTRATVYCTAVVEASQQPEPIVHDIKLGMEESDGKWLIRTVIPAQTLQVL
jgi:hypothetical protein